MRSNSGEEISASPRSQSEGIAAEKTPNVQSSDREHAYLYGWRLYLTTLGIILTFFLVNLEVTIVSTSLVAITNDLHGFSETSWVVSGYLVTYMGFMILWSKLSDIFGRKKCFLATLILFIAFSGACGGSRTMTQLIICRAFQGIGGAGGYSMSTLVTYEMVPKTRLPLHGALNSVSVALATLLGPLFGGLISDHTSWRWIFYLNLPVGAFLLGILWFAVPQEFPFSNKGSSSQGKTAQSRLPITKFHSLKRIDIVSATLLLSGALLLSSALLETSPHAGWSAGSTIVLLIFSGISWLSFFFWSWYTSRRTVYRESFFPWHFVHDRPWVAMLILTFLAGVPFNVVVIYLPQRLQIVSGKSALEAGIHLLPYTFGAAFGAVLANVLGSKRGLAIAHILLMGAVLQVLGLSLLATLPTSSTFPKKGYGYATISGVGMGMSFGILVLSTPFMVAQEDLAIASGSILQFRFLGGVVGLGIAANVLNDRVQSNLAEVLDARTLASLLQNVEIVKDLPSEVKEKVVKVFAEAYNLQSFIMIAFAGGQILALALGWNSKWVRRGWVE